MHGLLGGYLMLACYRVMLLPCTELITLFVLCLLVCGFG